MKREIRQSRIRNQLKLESKGIKYHLWRLDDTEEQKLRDNSLPIDDVYYRMYRIIEHNIEGYDTQRTREPFELEFSRQEINYFLSYFHGYISGCFKVANLMTPAQSFLKRINSNLILYGCRDGVYFEEQHEIPETFHASIKLFYENYDNTVDLPDVSELIKEITADEE